MLLRMYHEPYGYCKIFERYSYKCKNIYQYVHSYIYEYISR